MTGSGAGMIARTGFKRLVVSALIVLYGLLSAKAAPQKLNVQGYLLNNADMPESRGFQLTMLLVDANSNTLWSADAVPFTPTVESGFFSVEVPVDSGFGNLARPLAPHQMILQIEEVGASSEPMSVQLNQSVVSVPYALNAGQASRVAGDLVVAESLKVTNNTTHIGGDLTIRELIVEANDEDELINVHAESLEVLQLSGSDGAPALLTANEMVIDEDVMVRGDVSMMQFTQLVSDVHETGYRNTNNCDVLLLLLHPFVNFDDVKIEIGNGAGYTGTPFQRSITPNLPNGGIMVPLKANQQMELKSGDDSKPLNNYTTYLIEFRK